MQIWDFLNAFFALCQPLSVLDLCQFSRISTAEIINTLKQKVPQKTTTL